jgi:hypothetical protein
MSLKDPNMAPPNSPKNKPQKNSGESSSSFALLKGGLTETKQYFLSLAAAISAFVAFQAFLAEQLHVPKWTAWLAFIPPVLVFLFRTVPRLLEWRHKRVFIKTAEEDVVKQGVSGSAGSYFLIGPYGEDRREKYARADDMHVTVLHWLQNTDEQILISAWPTQASCSPARKSARTYSGYLTRRS